MLFKANLTYVSYFYFISDKLNPDNGLSNLSKMAFYKTSGKCRLQNYGFSIKRPTKNFAHTISLCLYL